MSLRRPLPLVLVALVALVACSGDDSDTLSDISLVPATEPVDLCQVEDEDGFEVAATVPDTTLPVVTTEPTVATAPTESSQLTDSSQPTESSQPIDSSEVTEPSQPTDSSEITESSEVTESSRPTDSSEITDSSQPTDPSEVTDASQPTDSSDVTESTVDPYAEAPEVELPEEIPTELERTVLKEGPSDGVEAGDGDIVSVFYVGVLSEDGSEFDSNYGSGTPFPVTIGAGGVIQGWDEGLVGARPGDRLQLDIPADLAYGEAGSPPAIPPDSALTFVIDVVDVVDVPEVDLPEEEPTELQRTVISEGPDDGPEVEDFDTVTVYARGVLSADGTEVENNFGSETTKSIIIGRNDPTRGDLAGLSEGLIGARPGDVLQLDIPADLAYGETGQAETGIPPDAALSYVVEVVEIVSPPEFEVPEESPDELGRTLLEEGDSEGRQAQRFDTVEIQFLGVVVDDGSVWESTFGIGDPIPLTLGQPSLPGLDEGLRGVRPGDVLQLDLPADEAFAETGSPDGRVPPDSAMTFVVEVDDVTGPPLVELPDEAPTQLTVTELEPGTGEPADVGDTVWVRYTAVLSEDGSRFATNFDGEPYPVTIGAGDVIAGWEEGLVGATTGAQLQIDVPADAAYGDAGVPAESIPEGAAVSFLVDVVAIVPATDAGEAPTDLELPISEAALEEVVVDDVTEGDGAELTDGTVGYADIYTVCANTGVLIDNSWGADNRIQLPMQSGQGGLMEGLYQGLQGIKAGGRRIISVPAELAYGEAGNLDLEVGANHDLIFVVDLYAVVDPTPPTPETTEPTETSEATGSTEPTDTSEPAATSEPSDTATSSPTATSVPTTTDAE